MDPIWQCFLAVSILSALLIIRDALYKRRIIKYWETNKKTLKTMAQEARIYRAKRGLWQSEEGVLELKIWSKAPEYGFSVMALLQPTSQARYSTAQMQTIDSAAKYSHSLQNYAESMIKGAQVVQDFDGHDPLAQEMIHAAYDLNRAAIKIPTGFGA